MEFQTTLVNPRKNAGARLMLLEDLLSMQQLGQVFRQMYANHITFAERNRGGETFLFQQARSKKELESMKRREGYA